VLHQVFWVKSDVVAGFRGTQPKPAKTWFVWKGVGSISGGRGCKQLSDLLGYVFILRGDTCFEKLCELRVLCLTLVCEAEQFLNIDVSVSFYQNRSPTQ